jgi:hypothetical protein
LPDTHEGTDAVTVDVFEHDTDGGCVPASQQCHDEVEDRVAGSRAAGQLPRQPSGVLGVRVEREAARARNIFKDDQRPTVLIARGQFSDPHHGHRGFLLSPGRSYVPLSTR